jgi:hypothetical protein
MFTDEFINWELGQQSNYTRVAGVDDQIIYFDSDSTFDYPNDINIYLNPNLPNASVLNRGFRLVIPTFGYRIYGNTSGGGPRPLRVYQTGSGVTTTLLAQFDTGRIPPMVMEFFWDPAFSGGKYRTAKYSLDTSLGDKDNGSGFLSDTQILGQSFSSHKKYAFLYGGNGSPAIAGSTTIIPRNAVIFADESILIGTGNLTTSNANSLMSFGLIPIGDLPQTFVDLIPNVPYSSIDPGIANSAEVLFKPKPMSDYGYGDAAYSNGKGFITKSDSGIGIIRTASPVSICRRVSPDATTTGNHILLVPYVVQGAGNSTADTALPPGKYFGGTAGAPDLYLASGNSNVNDVNLKKTLFVDENGVDATAVVGNINKPWNTLQSALSYIATNNLSGYTIHIFKGNYAMTAGVTVNTASVTSVNIYFELGARINFNPTSAGEVMFTVSDASSSFEFNIAGEYKNANSNEQGIINISNNGKLFLNSRNRNCELNLINLSVTNIASASSGNMIATTGVYSGAGTCSYNIENCLLKLNDSSSSGASSIVNIPNNTVSVTEKLTISDSTLINSGLFKTDAAITISETQSEISITNSVIANANVTPIIINQPDLFYISNVIFFDTNSANVGFTFSDSGTGGTTKIYIGARCVSNFKLPTSSNTNFLNMTGGILDCQLDLGNRLPSI